MLLVRPISTTIIIRKAYFSERDFRPAVGSRNPPLSKCPCIYIYYNDKWAVEELILL